MKEKFLFLIVPILSCANPSIMNVTEGEASAIAKGNLLEITTSKSTSIEWQNFSIAPNETTRFIQPSCNSTVLNRVISSNPSKIFGRLEANGNVLLINPEGVLFGNDSYINTASFIASTLDILKKGDGLEFVQNGEAGSVVNLGNIESTSGDVLLVAPNVENHGHIITTDGTSALIACNEMILKKGGKGRIFVKAHPDELEENIFASTFKHSDINATEFDGKSLIVSGTITSINSDETGGEIYLIGDSILLKKTSLIDASGDYGGGNVYIGGEYQGKEEQFNNAKLIQMDEGALIRADANQQGNGGSVILFADTLNDFHGVIEARGGVLQGNGGQVEVSSKRTLIYEGFTNLTAANGYFGTLFLDSTDVTISSGAQSPGVVFGNPTTLPAPPVNINVATLGGALGSANVTISTTSSYSQAGNVSIQDDITWGAGTVLTVLADGNLEVLAVINPTVGSFAGPNVDLRAGGTLSIGSATSMPTSVLSNGGGVFLRGENILIGDALNTTGAANITAINGTNGSIELIATNLIRLAGGSTSATATTATIAAASDVTITANQLELLGGGNTMPNGSFASIQSDGNQSINLTGPLTLQGGTTDDSQARIILGNSNRSQSITASSIDIHTGSVAGSEAQIQSDGNQSIITGDISMSSSVAGFPANAASLEYGASQSIAANSITAIGNIGFGQLTVPPIGTAPQTLNIVGNVSITTLPVAGTSAWFGTFPGGPQNGTIGGNVLLQSSSTSPITFVMGIGSDLTVNGNFSMISNGASVALSHNGTNDTLRIEGNLLMDSTAAGLVQMSFDDNFSLFVRGNAAIGTATGVGEHNLNLTDTFHISIGEDFSIHGGASVNAFAGIAHGPAASFLPPATVDVGGNMTLTGGSGTDAHARIFTYGPTDYQIGNNLSLHGGTGTSAQAYLSTWAISGVTDPSVAPDLLSVDTHDFRVGGNVLLQSSDTAAGAIAYIVAVNSLQTVSAGGNIQVLAGNGSLTNHALIGCGWVDVAFLLGTTVADTALNQMQAGGNISFHNSTSGSIAYFDQIASGILPPDITGFGVMALTNNGTTAVLAGGDVTLSSGISTSENPSTLGTHPINIEADHAFSMGVLWSGSGNPYLSGTILSSPSSTIQRNDRGGILIDTGILNSNVSVSSVAGDITVKSGERFTSGIFANLRVGPLTNELTTSSSIGDISIDPFHNITITNLIATGGSVFVMAQNDVLFTSSGMISANRDVNVVCDNQAPGAPLIGPGRFVMESGSSITSGGTLRIFTARQSQNSILGTLNTNTLIPGTLYNDTLQERWATYYNSLFNGVPFTVFYKDSPQQAFYQASIIIVELLRNLHSYGIISADGWEEQFEFIWSNAEEPYYIKRPRLLNNPKTYSTKYF